MTEYPPLVDSKIGLPAVAGPFTGSLGYFERRCLVHMEDEQEKPNPDNALIAVLCDAVRLAREYAVKMTERK